MIMSWAERLEMRLLYLSAYSAIRPPSIQWRAPAGLRVAARVSAGYCLSQLRGSSPSRSYASNTSVRRGYSPYRTSFITCSTPSAPGRCVRAAVLARFRATGGQSRVYSHHEYVTVLQL